MAKRVLCWRWPVLAMLIAAEIAVALVVASVSVTPATAQFFDGGFPFFQSPWGRQRRSYRSYRSQRRAYQGPYQDRRQQSDGDYAKAPAAKKAEGTPQMNVLVFGDSMADWLSYGLELSFAESPEMGVIRKHRTTSGLIRDARNDPKGDQPDWPKAAREILAAEKPDMIVMLIGLNDRRPIREPRAAPRPAAATPGQPGQPGQQATAPAGGQPAGAPAQQAPTQQQPAQQQAPAQAAPTENEPATGRSHEFRTEKWVELYIKRIDETIAALKAKGVPVFWVGLPPVRGTRSSADFSFLNDLFRSRADKAGIVYVDVWDGFVDDSGHFTTHGPDVEGQNRRLRAQDGVHFTEAGARKLAHFLERELQRWLTVRPAPVASPVEEPANRSPEPPKPGAPAVGAARPMSGPVVSLVGRRANEDDDALIGDRRQTQAEVDPVAAKVMIKGDAVPAPAGRADDFSWPRRGIAPVGADPAVSVATLPMTPMKTDQRAAPADAPPAPQAGAADPARPAPGPRSASRPAQRPSNGWFGNNWGWQQPYGRSRQQAQQPGFFPFLFRR